MSDTAIVTIMTGIVTIASLWLKLRYNQAEVEKVGKKLDHNTNITTAGTAVATAAAQTATAVAASTKEAVESIDKKLNGGLDSSINHAVAPIHKTLKEYEKNMDDMVERFAQLTEYVRKRNHDFADAINAQTLKLEAMFAILREKQQDGGGI